MIIDLSGSSSSDPGLILAVSRLVPYHRSSSPLFGALIGRECASRNHPLIIAIGLPVLWRCSEASGGSAVDGTPALYIT